ncbi:MAG: hypothetical protein M1826_007317 [Phylliscum demangeonii]|nr:MAG: hypothetical protein M1826_007317 [Phylliscum demangeonii]
MTIVPSPTTPAEEPPNVLIMLHALGHTHAPFADLARKLVAPRDPFHWGDDILFNPAHSQMDLDTGFQAAGRIIEDDIIAKGLVQQCGFRPEDVLLFGFGQAGMPAMTPPIVIQSITFSFSCP